jgi:hypothetical protein
MSLSSGACGVYASGSQDLGMMPMAGAAVVQGVRATGGLLRRLSVELFWRGLVVAGLAGWLYSSWETAGGQQQQRHPSFHQKFISTRTKHSTTTKHIVFLGGGCLTQPQLGLPHAQQDMVPQLACVGLKVQGLDGCLPVPTCCCCMSDPI